MNIALPVKLKQIGLFLLFVLAVQIAAVSVTFSISAALDFFRNK